MKVIKANTFFEQQEFEGPTIILDGLLTPDNIGSIFRLAGNIGSKQVVITERQELNETKIRKIARNSLQYIKILFLTYDEIIETFKNLIAIETCSKSKNIYECKMLQNASFIVGNEKYGISPELLKHCKQHVFIPMPGQVKSLNVSHALAIGVFEWYRQNFEETNSIHNSGLKKA